MNWYKHECDSSVSLCLHALGLVSLHWLGKHDIFARWIVEYVMILQVSFTACDACDLWLQTVHSSPSHVVCMSIWIELMKAWSQCLCRRCFRGAHRWRQYGIMELLFKCICSANNTRLQGVITISWQRDDHDLDVLKNGRGRTYWSAGAMDQSTDLSASILETLPVDLTTLILDLLSAEDRAHLSLLSKSYACISQQNWRNFTLHRSENTSCALDWIKGVALKRGESIQALKIQSIARYRPNLQSEFCRSGVCISQQGVLAAKRYMQSRAPVCWSTFMCGQARKIACKILPERRHVAFNKVKQVNDCSHHQTDFRLTLGCHSRLGLNAGVFVQLCHYSSFSI